MKEITLKESQPLLGQINNLKFLNPTHFFAFDRQGLVKEFSKDKAVKVWSKRGKGPCENESVQDITISQNGNELYLLNKRQGKLLIHRRQGGCREITDETLSQMFAEQKTSAGLFFIRGNALQSMPKDIPFIYRLDNDNKKLEPIGVTLSDLKIQTLLAPLQILMPTVRRENMIYFYVPLTKKVFRYDTVSQNMRGINVDIYVGDDKNLHTTHNMQKFRKVLSNDVEIVFHMFALEKGFALGYHRGNGQASTWGIKIFNQKGKLIASKKLDNQPVYMHDGTFITLKTNVSNSQTPYSLLQYHYQNVFNNENN